MRCVRVSLGVLGLALSALPASAQTTEAILQRLDKLERENAALRERVRKLEKPQAESNAAAKVPASTTPASTSTPADISVATVGSVVPTAATYAYGPGPVSAYHKPWAGFYLGIHGGYGWGNNGAAEVLPISLTPLVMLGDIGTKGGVFGVQAGYNWQNGPVVAGLEIDFSASNMKGKVSHTESDCCVTETFANADDIQYLGSMRARLGYASENFLFYGTGGLAWERIDRIETDTLSAPGVTQTEESRTPRDRFGWVAGLGGEARLAANWIIRAEYLHYDFGKIDSTTSFTTSPGGPNISDERGRQTIDLVRGGISYKFD